MTLPLQIQSRLLSGRQVAAEIPLADEGQRAYLLILPQAPDRYACPE